MSYRIIIAFIVIITLTHGVWADNIGSQSGIVPGSSDSEKVFDFTVGTSVRYLFRSARTNTKRYYDNDLFQDLQLSITMPGYKMFEFHFLGSVREDLDGGSDQTDFFPFEDIGDTRITPVFGYVHEAYFNINYLFPFLKQVRVGRQSGQRNSAVFFDGLAVDMDLTSRFFLTLYGGLAFHFFEIDYIWGSDLLGGAGIDYMPLGSTIVSLDYLFVKDVQDTVSPAGTYDHLFTVKIKQNSFSFLRPMIKIRFLNLFFQDLLISTISTFPEIDLEVSTRQTIRVAATDGFSNELIPYNTLMANLNPYYSFDGKIRKLFMENMAVDLGLLVRSLLGQQNSTAFNREFRRIYTAVELNNILDTGVFLSVTGELWFRDNNEYYSGGLDFGYSFRKLKKDGSISFGSYFSLYKYSYYPEPEEKELVQTFYTKARIPLGKNLSLNCSYEFEATIESYHTLKIGTRYDY
ncbi:MAG: hypothetical protein L3J12_05775 [Spirochaetales bacterium]|nr:hypothetical protein [Spirochaetales bacterium]